MLNEYRRIRGSKQAYRVIHRPVSRGLALAVFAECLAVGLVCGDQRRLTGSGSALEALRDDALYKSTYFTLLYQIRYFTFLCTIDHIFCLLQWRLMACRSLPTRTAYNALIYRLHRRRHTANIYRQWGGCHTPPLTFADASVCCATFLNCQKTRNTLFSIRCSVSFKFTLN